MNSDFYLRMAMAALVIIGIWNAFGPGMIFSRIGDRLEQRAPNWFKKPVAFCPPCMASVHGTWVWFWLDGPLKEWPIFILALSGAMKLITVNFLRHD